MRRPPEMDANCLASLGLWKKEGRAREILVPLKGGRSEQMRRSLFMD
jgi:hypothetical protein